MKPVLLLARDHTTVETAKVTAFCRRFYRVPRECGNGLAVSQGCARARTTIQAESFAAGRRPDGRSRDHGRLHAHAVSPGGRSPGDADGQREVEQSALVNE